MGHSHTKDHGHAPISGDERYKEARHVTLVGSVIDLLLGVAKIIVGFIHLRTVDQAGAQFVQQTAVLGSKAVFESCKQMTFKAGICADEDKQVHATGIQQTGQALHEGMTKLFG